MTLRVKSIVIVLVLSSLMATLPAAGQEKSMNATPIVQPAWMKDASAKFETELVAKYGEAQRARAHRGVDPGRPVLARRRRRPAVHSKNS